MSMPMTLQESRELDVQELLNKPTLSSDDVLQIRGAAFGHKAQRSKVSTHLTSGSRNAVEIGALQWAVGNCNKAITQLESQSDDATANYFLLRAMRDSGKNKKALAVARDAVQKFSGDFRLHTELMFNFEALELWSELQDHVNSLSGTFDQEAEWHYHKGFCLEIHGDHGVAIGSYEQALTINERHAESLFRLARLCDYSGEDNKAIELYEQCRQTLPIHTNAVLNLGILYEDQENYEKAIVCYEQVLKVFPAHDRARLFLKDCIASMNMVYDEEVERKYDKQKQILNIAVTDFELSVRSRNCLNKMNLRVLGDLVTKTEPELLSFKNFGETSLTEIKQILASKGLRLGMSIDEDRLKYKRPNQAEPTEEEMNANSEFLAKPVSELDLSVRSRKCMERLNLSSIAELVTKSEAELLSMRNFGQASVNEIKQKLAQYQLKLKD